MVVRICPNITKGVSTGLAPIHVKRREILINIQNFDFFEGLNFLLMVFFLNISRSKIKIAAPMAITPPSFDGIARKMA